MEQYLVKKVEKPIDWCVTVPGSKSMTNRALLMAALSSETVTLEGVLFSDDSRHFLSSLIALGFEVNVEEEQKRVTVKGEKGSIPKKEAEIDVGSAGTAARFLTAMLGMSDGCYTINASEQMKKRPMKDLFVLLEKAGATITYLEKEGFLPVKILGRLAVLQKNGSEKNCGYEPLKCRSERTVDSGVDDKLTVELDISKSTQFLSAMLLISPMIPQGLHIHITSEKTDGSYIRITRSMMEDWGVQTQFDGRNYEVLPGAAYKKTIYIVEPDMSAACYFYGAAAITGGKAVVPHVHMDNTQGDKKFLAVLEKLGCKVMDTEKGICVEGPAHGNIHGIDIDMNDFSDQTMTLATMAPYADAPVHISHIGHIRLQESDRIHAIVTELRRIGIRCEEEEDAITIYPGIPHPAAIETYEDHRMAMAFSLLGLRTAGITIRDPMCCKKTFEDYFKILDELTHNTGTIKEDR